jgi:hypothetical protein
MPSIRRIALTVFLCFILSTGPHPCSSGQSAASELIQRTAGVYKRRFKNGLVDGSAFTSEDILEIVPYREDAVYFRTHLEFFNGHLCSFSGIARYQDDKLVFEDLDPKHYYAKGRRCRLELRPDSRGLEFNDVDDVCRTWACGARGGFRGARFDYSLRRKIRYLERLKRSRQYREAAQAYDTGHPAQ